ncbi:hypothetical protein KIM372_09690 [Bombiscardovia nodaiensis]|uniref:Uncharacterized protein n=1 Tax=Bombiscardovia nodaiensis TaxID=2932181 RepID=A0ABM8B8C0_9BIFI|nr:hypothetical protein KIM372_09690 [Bombiscardovia nodaiensis]
MITSYHSRDEFHFADRKSQVLRLVEYTAFRMAAIMLFLIIFGNDSTRVVLSNPANWVVAAALSTVLGLHDWFTDFGQESERSWERRQVQKGLTWRPKKVYHRADFPKNVSE